LTGQYLRIAKLLDVFVPNLGEREAEFSLLYLASGVAAQATALLHFSSFLGELHHTRSMSQPIYSQGTLDGRKIRLVFIHPADNERERLECTCLPFNIDKAPPYEALSYAWGSLEQPDEITCNRQVIEIRPVLSAALKRLRRQNTARIIWADAICINQSDNVEKSHQVPLMGSIYSQAKRIVVWLGSGNPQETTTAFEAIQYIAGACYQYNRDKGIKDEDYVADRTGVRLPGEAFGPTVCKCLWELFAKPWFSRIWCVQEIRLARDALVLWGQMKIPWADLAMSASWILDKTTEVGVENDPLIPLVEEVFVANAREMGEKGTATLLELLEYFHEFQATDPRDKVYGLLSLVSPRSERDAIQVDYNKTVEQVYAETVLIMIQLYSQLSTLAYVIHLEHYAGKVFGDGNKEHDEIEDDYDEAYKSWVPLWNDPINVKPLGQPCQDCPWRPCGQDAIFGSDIYDPKPKQLYLRGLFYDKVREVLDVIRSPGWNAPTLRELQPIFKVYKHISIDLYPSDIGEELQRPLARLARTMTAGQWGTASMYLQDLDADAEKRYYMAFKRFIASTMESQDTSNDGESQHNTDSKQFELDVFHTCHLRRMFWTENSSLGLGPMCMRSGDVVVVLHGGNTPYVLRPSGDKYLFMGQAYVDDIMDGQLMEKLSRGEVHEQDFCLI
jgi:hypothetical protein